MASPTRLPGAIQTALRQLACLGNGAAIAILRMATRPEQGGARRRALGGGAGRAGVPAGRGLPLPARPGAGSRLCADPEGERAAAHLRIGRLLAAHTPPEAVEESIFEIVGQLNRGAALITSGEEREQLAELN